MSEPQTHSTRSLNLVLPGAVIVLLALSGYVALNPSLQSSRPEPSDTQLPGPPSADGLFGDYARLWEDPLEAAHKVKEPQDDGDPYQDAQKHLNAVRTRMKNLVESGLKAPHGNVPEDGKSFHVMAVLLPGAPHAESSETRRRIRYAVTSGLSVAGYHFEFPDRITYANVPLKIEMKAVGGDRSIALRVPMKLYRTSNLHSHDALPRTSRVLVLWVNESRLGVSPLNAICQLFDQLFQDPGPSNEESHVGRMLGLIWPFAVAPVIGMSQPLRELPSDRESAADTRRDRMIFSVVGPSSSDTLLAMASEIAKAGQHAKPHAKDEANNGNSGSIGQTAVSDGKFPKWPLKRLTIFNYRATIGGDELDEDESVRQFFSRGFDAVPSSPYMPQGPDDQIPQFVRMIGTDRQLVEELFRELDLRDVLPRSNNDTRHLVILTERDTLYGRGLRELFRFQEETTNRPEFGIPSHNLHLFTYLRGIDGQTASEAKQEKDKDQTSSDEMARFESELPAGPSQYDYIRRVAQQVVQLQTRLRRSGGGDITAVGVMGTDVYDKLLILRALRDRLANAIYFTTDLDAALSHPSEYKWTRNLVVASHFGRQLHPALQREAPVFRDSYQTSCYLATLVAAGDEVALKLFVDSASQQDPWRLDPAHSGADDTRHLVPLTFEISRTGPYQLTSTGGPWLTLQWFEELRDTASREAPLTGLVNPPGDRSTRAVSAERVGFAAVSLILFVVLIAASLSPGRRLAANVLSALRSCVGQGLPSWPQIGSIATLATVLVLLVVLAVDAYRANGEPMTVAAGVSVWPTIVLRVIATLLAAYFTAAAIVGVYRRERQVEEMFCLGGAAGDQPPATADSSSRRAVWTWIKDVAWRWRDLLPDRVYGERQAPEQPSDGSVTDKWNRLQRRTRVGTIIVRVTPQVLLFALFTIYLAPLGDPRSRPVRGDLASSVESVSFLLSLLGIIVVTLVVLDLTQCVRYFAKSIRKATDLQWPDEYTSQQGGTERNQRQLVGEHATVESLAILSKTFSRLIVYPSVVLVVLILAHLSIFDNWTLAWPLLILILICIAAAIYGNFSLRNEVRKVRDDVLRRLRQQRFSANQALVKKYDLTIDEIAAERRGAFRPLAEDPLIQAITLPFGGVGGVVILEQLFQAMG